MQAINSTVKILLIDKNPASSVQIEHHLTQITSSLMKLSKIQELEDILGFKPPIRPDLIFWVFNLPEDSHVISSTRIKKVNLDNIPIILFSPEVNIDVGTLPLIVKNYLSLAELSPDLLARTIFFTLKEHQNNDYLELIKQENLALTSQLITTKNLFQTIIDNTSTLVWMCNQKGESTFFNQAWSRVLGQEAATKLDSNWMLNIHPQDLKDCEEQFTQALAKAQGFTISYRLQNFNHQYRWIYNYAVPQFTLSGEFTGLVGYCFDITALKKTEQKLIQKAASDRLIAQITQKIHASLNLNQILKTTVEEAKQFLLAEKIQINRVEDNNQLTLLFESRLKNYPLSCDLSETRQISEILFPNNLARLSAGETVTQDLIQFPPQNTKFCSILLIPIICETKLWGLICIENCSISRQWQIEEIRVLERIALELSVAIRQAKLYQQLEDANRELQQLSVIDSLTQIANRRKFDQYIATEWVRLSREQSPLSLIFCDLDYFKLYNDTYGHQAGDLCLQSVAQAIARVIKRPTDLLARYGGEEFVLVLPKTTLAGASYLAEQIRLQVKSLQIPHFCSEVDLYVTISLGISCCIPHPDYDFEVLVAAADQALYQAKETGRDRAVECKLELP